MKRFLICVLLLLMPTLFLGVGLCASAWQAYLLPDGSIIVTDGESEGESISALTLGVNETRYIEVASPVYSFQSSSMYVRVDEDGMLLCEGAGRATLKVYYATGSYVEIKITVSKAPASIKLNRSSVTMDPGQTAKLEYTLSRDSAGFVTYYSADEDVVSVDQNGLLKAIAPGRAQVYVETYNGKTAECSVTVTTPAPATIEVAGEFTGYAFEGFNLNASLKGGFNETISYQSLNPEICSVDDEGNVSCYREGIAMIVVSASGGRSVNCMVTVQPAADAISAETAHVYLYIGGKADLPATTHGGTGAYSLVSMDEGIAQIEDNCVVALKAGDCVIRPTAPGGAYCEVILTVLPFPAECRLTVDRTSIAVGECMYCSVASSYTAAMPFALASSDESVLNVNSDGLIRALRAGTATLSATSGGYTQEIEIEVSNMARSISFETEEVLCGVGDKVKLNLIYKDGGGEATYSSSNPLVAEVDAEGNVRPISQGSAEITARLLNGASASAEITVMPAARAIYPETERAVIGQGDTLKLNFSFDEGCYSLVTWRSLDESVISTLEDGTVKSTGALGGAYVEASTALGATARIYVEVISAPTDVQINAEKLTNSPLFTDYIKLFEDEIYELKVEFDGYTYVTYTLESLDSDVASIDDGGMISALKSSTARIRLTTYNGYTRNILVEID